MRPARYGTGVCRAEVCDGRPALIFSVAHGATSGLHRTIDDAPAKRLPRVRRRCAFGVSPFPEPVETERVMTRDPLHHHAVLVVEDYRDLRDALVYELSGAGFDARGVASGRAALDLLAGGYTPCLMLLDLKLPDMSGWDMCRRLHDTASAARVPVVVLTGAAQARNDGDVHVSCVLTKPAAPDAVVAAIAMHARCPSDPDARPRRAMEAWHDLSAN